MNGDKFWKEHDRDKIWWTEGNTGEWLFSFDKQTVYNMFRDYPHNMTPAEVAIFDKENPYWADFFKDRKKG